MNLKQRINISALPDELANKILVKELVSANPKINNRPWFGKKTIQYTIQDFIGYVKNNTNIYNTHFDPKDPESELLDFIFPHQKEPLYSKDASSFCSQIPIVDYEIKGLQENDFIDLKINNSKYQIMFGPTFDTFLSDVWEAILIKSNFTINLPYNENSIYREISLKEWKLHDREYYKYDSHIIYTKQVNRANNIHPDYPHPIQDRFYDELPIDVIELKMMKKYWPQRESEYGNV